MKNYVIFKSLVYPASSFFSSTLRGELNLSYDEVIKSLCKEFENFEQDKRNNIIDLILNDFDVQKKTERRLNEYLEEDLKSELYSIFNKIYILKIENNRIEYESIFNFIPDIAHFMIKNNLIVK